jgi:hypothetical protein
LNENFINITADNQLSNNIIINDNDDVNTNIGYNCISRSNGLYNNDENDLIIINDCSSRIVDVAIRRNKNNNYDDFQAVLNKKKLNLQEKN